MSAHYTESHYENAVLQFFQEQLGYTYIYGPDIERDYHSPLYRRSSCPYVLPAAFSPRFWLERGSRCGRRRQALDHHPGCLSAVLKRPSRYVPRIGLGSYQRAGMSATEAGALR